jgi:hypothetical protein
MSFRTSTLVLNKIVVTNDYPITDNDFNIVCDATSNDILVTLPDCRDVAGQLFSICVSNFTHAVTVNTIYGLINMLPTFDFHESTYRAIILQSIGTKYVILSSHVAEYSDEIIGEDSTEEEII